MAYKSPPRPLSPGKTAEAVRLYGQGVSLRQIAALLRRDRLSVRKSLVNAGVEIRPVGRPERKPPDHNLT